MKLMKIKRKNSDLIVKRTDIRSILQLSTVPQVEKKSRSSNNKSKLFSAEWKIINSQRYWAEGADSIPCTHWFAQPTLLLILFAFFFSLKRLSFKMQQFHCDRSQFHKNKAALTVAKHKQQYAGSAQKKTKIQATLKYQLFNYANILLIANSVVTN